MNNEVWDHLNIELEELLRKNLDELLFMKDSLEPMEFRMQSALRSKEIDILKKFRQLVERSGGNIIFNLSAGGPHAIKFSHVKRMNISSNSDIFLSQFIIDSVRRNEVLDLNDYRASKSHFSDNVDVNKILRGELSWEDAERKAETSGEEVSDFSDEENDRMTLASLSRTRQTSLVTKSYSREEEKAILAYIVTNKYYYKVKGNEVWKRMEDQKVCASRSWQSMKGRYLKHIIPRINQFPLEPYMKKRVLCLFESEVASGSIKGVEKDFLSKNSLKDYFPPQISNCLNNRSKEKENNVESEKNNENSEKLRSVSKPRDNSPTPSNTLKNVSSYNPIPQSLRAGHNSESFREKKDRECNDLSNQNNNSSHTQQNCDGVQDDLLESQHLNHVSEKLSQSKEGSVATTVERTENPVKVVQENDSIIPETPEAPCNLDTPDTPGQDLQYRNILNELQSSQDVRSEKKDHEDHNEDSDDTIIFFLSENMSDKDLSQISTSSDNKNNSKHSSPNTSQLLMDCAFSGNESDKPIPLQMKIDQNKEQTKTKHSSSDSSQEGVSKTKVHYRKAFLEKKSGTKPKEVSRTSTPTKEARGESPSSLRVRNRPKRNLHKTKVLSDAAASSSDDSDLDCSSRTIGRLKTYTEEDDLAILNYLYKHSRFNKIGGNVIWVEMEERAVVPGRSWHSLKERFRRRILPRIKQYKNVSPKVVQMLNKNTSHQDGDLGNRSRQKFNIKYSLDEDKRIIKFIVENKRFKEIKGKAMWVSMAETRDLEGRTWESLKNRFLKNIVPNLHKFKLKDEHKSNFEAVLCVSGRSKRIFSKPSTYKKPLKIIKKKTTHTSSSSEDSVSPTDIQSDLDSDMDLTLLERIQKRNDASVTSNDSTTRNKVQSEKLHPKEKPATKDKISDGKAREMPSTSKQTDEFMYKCEGLESDNEMELEIHMEENQPISTSPNRKNLKGKKKLYCVAEDLFAKTPLPVQPMRQSVEMKAHKIQDIVSKEGNSDQVNEHNTTEENNEREESNETENCNQLTHNQTVIDVHERPVSKRNSLGLSPESTSLMSKRNNCGSSPESTSSRFSKSGSASPTKSIRSSLRIQQLEVNAVKRTTRSNTSLNNRVKRRRLKGAK